MLCACVYVHEDFMCVLMPSILKVPQMENGDTEREKEREINMCVVAFSSEGAADRGH